MGKTLSTLILALAFSAPFVFYPAPSFSETAQTPSMEKTAPEAGAAAAFTVNRLVVAGGIEAREPVGEAETFPAATERVYCFLEAGSIAEDTEAVFVWYRDGQEAARVSLPLGKGPRWRTYTSKLVSGKAGSWKVDVADKAGNVLKSVSFKVE